jgi:hypothetical protein
MSLPLQSSNNNLPTGAPKTQVRIVTANVPVGPKAKQVPDRFTKVPMMGINAETNKDNFK